MIGTEPTVRRENMKRILTLAVLAALAQPAAAATVLHLSETAHVSVHPDEVAASLSFDATAATPVAAQAQVNGAIGKALDQAKAAQGVVASTGWYRVWQTVKPANEWHASQQIELKQTGDGETLLKLVAALQSQGMALQQLGWQVSPETARKARDEATRAALAALRGRAEAAADLLGLRFISFREVNLDAGRPTPGPFPRAMAMAATAEAMPTPRAEAADVDIEATVSADADLEPKNP
jgi:predicted secreted protein